MTFWEAIALLANVALALWMYRQHRRHNAYRERMQKLLVGGNDYVEGEAQAIIDEMWRATHALKMKVPDGRDFATALLNQESFRKAVANDELQRTYVEHHGRWS